MALQLRSLIKKNRCIAFSQKNCLRQAVVVFAENRQLHQLISIDYGCLELDVKLKYIYCLVCGSMGLVFQMIDIMESRARTADLLSNDYYDFLFSFFVSRRNYRKGLEKVEF